MENNTDNEIKPRKGIIAFFLSILTPGLGQLYNGQWKKAILFSLGLLTLVICFNILGFKGNFTVYVVSLAFLILLYLAILIEARITARKRDDYILKSYNKWYFYLLAIIFWFLLVSLAQSISNNSRYKTFRVSSDSGVPNIKSGDVVVADFKIYNYQEPKYGDMVVFSMPNANSYVYRIVGMPGDTMMIVDRKVVYIYKQLFAKFVSNQKYEQFEMKEFIETLPNGKEYKIFLNIVPLAVDSTYDKEFVVPKGSYFVMGDNRDFSMDSRFIGFVKREQIKGKVLSILYSKDFKRINEKLSK